MYASVNLFVHVSSAPADSRRSSHLCRNPAQTVFFHSSEQAEPAWAFAPAGSAPVI
ncbi:hypothetical protein CLOM621_08410 [Clostridium sp. M62/1]|nr:hypothetical protein CLOM621_08410 [Clostridium sp. M62/1]